MMKLKWIILFGLVVGCSSTDKGEHDVNAVDSGPDVGIDGSTDASSNATLTLAPLFEFDLSFEPQGPIFARQGHVVFRNGKDLAWLHVESQTFDNEKELLDIHSYAVSNSAVMAIRDQPAGLLMEVIPRNPPVGPMPTFGQPITLATGGSEPIFGLAAGNRFLGGFTLDGRPTVVGHGTMSQTYTFDDATNIVFGSAGTTPFFGVVENGSTQFHTITEDASLEDYGLLEEAALSSAGEFFISTADATFAITETEITQVRDEPSEIATQGDGRVFFASGNTIVDDSGATIETPVDLLGMTTVDGQTVVMTTDGFFTVQ